MEETTGDSCVLGESGLIKMLKEGYMSARFRILVIGRANAGKTTILEKVCKVEQGVKPIVLGANGVEVKFDGTKNVPRWRRLIGRGKEPSGQNSERDSAPVIIVS